MNSANNNTLSNKIRSLLKKNHTEPLPFEGKAAIVDISTTGFSSKKDEITELAVILFSFDPESGKITGIIEEYSAYQEPSVQIKPAARKLYALTDKSLKGMQLNTEKISQILEDAEFIVSHDAKFDKAFLDPILPNAKDMKWYCSMNGINWLAKGSLSKNLNKLLNERNIQFAEKPRALDNAKAVLSLLSCTDYKDNPFLMELLSRPALYVNNVYIEPLIDKKPESDKKAKKKQPKSNSYALGVFTTIIAVVIIVFLLR